MKSCEIYKEPLLSITNDAGQLGFVVDGTHILRVGSGCNIHASMYIYRVSTAPCNRLEFSYLAPLFRVFCIKEEAVDENLNCTMAVCYR